MSIYVSPYCNAVYESLRFGALKSDSIHHFFGNVRLIAVLSVFQLLYDLVNFCITIICGVIVLSVVSQHEYQYIQSCLYLPASTYSGPRTPTPPPPFECYATQGRPWPPSSSVPHKGPSSCYPGSVAHSCTHRESWKTHTSTMKTNIYIVAHTKSTYKTLYVDFVWADFIS